MQRLGSADVAWLRMESVVNPMVVVGMLHLGERLEVETLKRLLRERLLVIGRFRQRIVHGRRPTWETDPRFDLDRHVHAVTLDPVSPRRHLEAFIDDRLSTPLDLVAPPWEAHLIEDYEGGSIVVMVLHHAIADGIALVRVLLSLADEHFDELDHSALPDYGEGRADALPPPKPRRAHPPPDGILARTGRGLHLSGAAWHIATLPMDSDTRFKRSAGRRKRAAWGAAIPLRQVRAAGEPTGAKVNDVVLAAVAGGLRRYLSEKGEPVDDVEIGTVIPVNLRDPADAFELGNRFGIVFLSLPIGIEDREERLAEVRRRMDRLKGSGEPLVALGILKAIGAGPRILHRKVVDRLSAKSSAVVTNVPGPTERLHLDGIPLTEVMYWVPRAGDVGLGISIISYDGSLQIGVAGDEGMVPDPELLVEAITQELERLG